MKKKKSIKRNGKSKRKIFKSSFSPKQNYELLRIRISSLEKEVTVIKQKLGITKDEPEDLGLRFQEKADG
jgi:hypothetical protein